MEDIKKAAQVGLEQLKNHRKKAILLAAAALALKSQSGRSWLRLSDNLTVDVSVWGEKTKLIFADAIDHSREHLAGIAGRLSGHLILGPDNQPQDITLPEDLEVPDERLDILEAALKTEEGWSGQSHENPLQTG
jgi:hypothetical protein